ncbi:MAG: EpsG family protein [Lachnospiraceae bacterium]|nr:EpsG family protein [Lachnospiraceae bacterium]
MKLQIKTKHLINFLTAAPLAVFMWLLFALNTSNVDMANYERRFRYGTTEFAESGFNAFINACKFLGADSYQGFLCVLSFILLAVIFCCTLKFTDHAASILALFCFYPFLLFCIEVRFSISFCIVLVAVLVLARGYRHSIPIFIGLILLATLFHSSSMLYFLLAFYKADISHKKKFYIIMLLTAAAIVLTYTPLAYRLAALVSGGSSKITAWFTRHGRFGMVIPIAEQTISYLVFKYAYRMKKKYGIQTAINADILYELNLLMFILVPCYFINNTFFRLYRVFLFVNTIFYSEIIYHRKGDGSWKITRLGMLNALQILFLSFLEIFSRPDVWTPFFENNLFLDKLGEFF